MGAFAGAVTFRSFLGLDGGAHGCMSAVGPAAAATQCKGTVGLRVRISFPPAGSQVRTCLWREFASYVDKARFSAGVRAGVSGAVGRDASAAATSGRRAVISLSGHIPVPHRGDVGSLTIAVVLSSDRAQAKPSAIR